MVTINDAAFGNGNGQTTNTINASALSAIGGKTTGTVTVDNAVKIVGSQAQVTGALVTANTLVAAGTAVVSINDAAFGDGNNGTTTNTINASALSAIGGKTTGTVTVDNAVKIVGSQAQVTGALVTANTLVSAGSAVVSINDTAFGNGQNGTTTNTINASVLSTIGGKTTGTVTVDNAVKIVGSQAQVTGALVTTNTLVSAGTAVVTINDAAFGNGNGQTTNTINASALSAGGGKTTGTVTVSNAVKIVGSQAQVTGAVATNTTSSSRISSGYY